MSLSTRILGAAITSVPAIVLGAFVVLSAGEEYFWRTYGWVCGVFLAASFVLGLILSPRMQGSRPRRAWLWLLLAGALAWLTAVFTLALLNLTPLCVGQDNGDGNNDLALCVVQTAAVALVYSPFEFALLGLSAVLGGLLANSRIRRAT